MPSRNSISAETKEEVLSLRGTGLSYDKIAKQTKISRSSVIKIIRQNERANIKEGMIREATENPLPDGIEARVLKHCVNPRIIMIYFGEKENFAKCVVRAGLNYPINKTLMVKRVETSEEPLYRLA